jgi:hypothetical protein
MIRHAVVGAAVLQRSIAGAQSGDTLYSELELERCEPLAAGGALAHLRSRVVAIGAGGDGAVGR